MTVLRNSMVYGNTYFDSPRVPLKRYSKAGCHFTTAAATTGSARSCSAKQATLMEGDECDAFRNDESTALKFKAAIIKHRQANERSS
eukprot:scaffold8160_cov144-Skeletonema_dohrnii-CCMP3373.AAC.6